MSNSAVWKSNKSHVFKILRSIIAHSLRALCYFSVAFLFSIEAPIASKKYALTVCAIFQNETFFVNYAIIPGRL